MRKRTLVANDCKRWKSPFVISLRDEQLIHDTFIEFLETVSHVISKSNYITNELFALSAFITSSIRVLSLSLVIFCHRRSSISKLHRITMKWQTGCTNTVPTTGSCFLDKEIIAVLCRLSRQKSDSLTDSNDHRSRGTSYCKLRSIVAFTLLSHWYARGPGRSWYP